jgi:hypothetical protein
MNLVWYCSQPSRVTPCEPKVVMVQYYTCKSTTWPKIDEAIGYLKDNTEI